MSDGTPPNQPPPTPAPPPGHGPPPGYGAPPPGYGGPPPGYGAPPPGYPAPPASGDTKVAAATWWALLAVVAIALAVSLPEDGDSGWGRIGVWAGFAIAAAVATLVPALRSSLNLGEERAWQVAVAGGVSLAGYWVLFVLPAITMNVSFLATVGCAAGGIAAWLAPGRPRPSAGEPTW